MSVDIFGNFTGEQSQERRKAEDTDSLDYSYSDLVNQGISRIETKSRFHSLLSVRLVSILIFVVLLFRLFTLQVIEGKDNERLAAGNRIRPRIIEAARGNILDRSGAWLARNQPSFALAIYPADLPKNKKERNELYEKVAEISGLSTNEIKDESEKNGLSYLGEILLKENLPHDEALLLEEKILGLPGITVAKRAIRQYQSSDGLAHLAGYMGIISQEEIKKREGYLPSDRIGKTGLELQYEDALKGSNGVEQVEVDSKGNVARVLVQDGSRQPVPGDDLTLNLDLALQQKVATALRGGIEQGKQLSGSDVVGGAAIVMDVNTGAVRSLVSLPEYDNNLFTTKISKENYEKLTSDKGYPMFNRATKGTYPPGSISKIILAAAGLQEGVISLNTLFDTPPDIRIGEYVFPDWKDHGVTEIKRAIAESNNIFFYAIGGGFENIKGLGIDRIKKYWELFGLGNKTGIDLPAEASGLLPDAKWKEDVKKEPWYIGDTYHVAIGQGDLLVTPLQMIRATAAIANGGKLIEPHLVDRITDIDGKLIFQNQPKVLKDQFVNKSAVKPVQEGMRMAVTEGSARSLADLPFPVAGKTGTAQFLNNQKTHAWFTCYAPYDNPEIAVTVLVEGGGAGNEIAVPVAKEILKSYFGQVKN